ncbi:ROK family protein [Knoellia subterranea]|uniref:ROK family transcriptional regulator n=1 Tax=Knoellia subterranea KCTC 19937 TaxID=1385521 RepID=A0A0A0JPM9_9MICO|nr:ROK family protein [Knoellia subterranea]KGN37531.1 ROK family transcriptional regulator [Knoellia subterranea KCTC 19937]
MMLVAGVDVGGTRIKSMLSDLDGSVVLSHTASTPPRPGDSIVEVIAETVATLVQRARADGITAPLAAVGAVVPGLVDEVNGMAAWSANLGWRDLPLRDRLQERFDVPVAIGHDVRAGLLAEFRLGAAQGSPDALFVPLGTGIASALLAGGQVVAGSEWTGEIGHVVVEPDGPPCGCGRLGCLEAVASAAALGRAWNALGRDGDAETLSRAVEDGDHEAIRLWEGAIDALVRVMAPVCAAAGTRLVLVGGGLALAGATLLDPLRDRLVRALGHDRITVTQAALGDRAGALGATLLAMEAIA